MDEQKDCTVYVSALRIKATLHIPDYRDVSNERPENIKRIEAVLDSLRNGSSITQACQAADIGRSHFYRWVAANPENKLALNAILDERVYVVEDALFKNAMSGKFGAQVWFLINRAPDRWKDSRAIIGNVNIQQNVIHKNEQHIHQSTDIIEHEKSIEQDLERYLLP